MMRRFADAMVILASLSPAMVSAAEAAVPTIAWERLFGGGGWDYGFSVTEARDGGLFLCGQTESFGHGKYDVYLIKTDRQGNGLWACAFGGEFEDGGSAVYPTNDGGAIVAAFTGSDIYSTREPDLYLIKTDEDGNEDWSRTFGGPKWESGLTVQQTRDGGYIVGGHTDSFGTGLGDSYLIRTDAAGNEMWSRYYGGVGNEWAWSVCQTQDGGFIITGVTDFDGLDPGKVFLTKLGASGDEEWTRYFGGSGEDSARSVLQTEDGGYIVCGWTDSFGAGLKDVYVIRTDPDGREVWSETYGGDASEMGYSLTAMPDGSFVVGGTRDRFGDVMADGFAVGIDAQGQELWSVSLGGDEWDEIWSVEATTDGGLVLAGYTCSFDARSQDVYLVKLSFDSMTQVPFLRGRINPGESIEIADAVCLLRFLFHVGDDPCDATIRQCLDKADANDDGALNLADATAILSYLFADAGLLPAPFDECGNDPTADALGCNSFSLCE